ncbi:methyltransferase [Micromonospora craniellae]|uniref:Methyltransferase n=1 Tax=Micromonospora craniellae TaxID=2294034 RepID=A0A372G4M5_9ACTN|nr:methyltransferase [Micromonospora craniellae]QOC90670.1 methyltransferase [Micromonospora craniellae]RFS47952.1 methyltransferase [Micromonospora craniellae]
MGDDTAGSVVTGLMELALGAAHAAAVRAAVTLHLPDVLGETPMEAAELAAAVGADPAALGRLLRSLAAHGVFAERGAGRYVHTSLSLALRSDTDDSLVDVVRWCTEPWNWALWGELAEAIRTGDEVFTAAYGSRFYQHLHRQWPESARTFERAMTQQSRAAAVVLADLLSLADARSVADIGGGQGIVLLTLLRRHPGLRGYLLDLPSVIANVDARLRPDGELGERVDLVAGDCLAEIPVRADVYLFKNILGVDGDSSVRILRNAVAAAPPGARMVIVEHIADEAAGNRLATLMDLRMLVVTGGQKHTWAGLLEVIQRAGLTIREIRAVDATLHMVVAT